MADPVNSWPSYPALTRAYECAVSYYMDGELSAEQLRAFYIHSIGGDAAHPAIKTAFSLALQRVIHERLVKGDHRRCNDPHYFTVLSDAMKKAHGTCWECLELPCTWEGRFKLPCDVCRGRPLTRSLTRAKSPRWS